MDGHTPPHDRPHWSLSAVPFGDAAEAFEYRGLHGLHLNYDLLRIVGNPTNTAWVFQSLCSGCPWTVDRCD